VIPATATFSLGMNRSASKLAGKRIRLRSWRDLEGAVFADPNGSFTMLKLFPTASARTDSDAKPGRMQAVIPERR
jgi:hypothetical protein